MFPRTQWLLLILLPFAVIGVAWNYFTQSPRESWSRLPPSMYVVDGVPYGSREGDCSVDGADNTCSYVFYFDLVEAEDAYQQELRDNPRGKVAKSTGYLWKADGRWIIAWDESASDRHEDAYLGHVVVVYEPIR